jgi:hypothetical protein
MGPGMGAAAPNFLSAAPLEHGAENEAFEANQNGANVVPQPSAAPSPSHKRVHVLSAEEFYQRWLNQQTEPDPLDDQIKNFYVQAEEALRLKIEGA